MPATEYRGFKLSKIDTTVWEKGQDLIIEHRRELNSRWEAKVSKGSPYTLTIGYADSLREAVDLIEDFRKQTA